jgi:hypothetical protein
MISVGNASSLLRSQRVLHSYGAVGGSSQSQCLGSSIRNATGTEWLRRAVALCGGCALTTKHHRGIGFAARNIDPQDPHDATGATVARVPTGAARTTALARGRRADRPSRGHERSPITRASNRRRLTSLFGSVRKVRERCSRTVGESRMTLQDALDGRSLITTVVSRVAISVYLRTQRIRGFDRHFISPHVTAANREPRGNCCARSA